ncbi:hypothetical protein TNCV_129491 [Trichonephila clavipes]|nr:hypothetical protein TNCV_129491 [Trichonephila clavipes]
MGRRRGIRKKVKICENIRKAEKWSVRQEGWHKIKIIKIHKAFFWRNLEERYSGDYSDQLEGAWLSEEGLDDETANAYPVRITSDVQNSTAFRGKRELFQISTLIRDQRYADYVRSTSRRILKALQD